jgi:hypothetical protein
MTKSAAHDVEEIQTGICILHGVGNFKHPVGYSAISGVKHIHQ